MTILLFPTNVLATVSTYMRTYMRHPAYEIHRIEAPWSRLSKLKTAFLLKKIVHLLKT